MRSLALLVVLALVPPLVPPAGAAETARQILDRRKALDDGPRRWTDRTETLALTIVDGRGGQRERELKRWDRKRPDGTVDALVFFQAPADVKGTGFLAVAAPGKVAEQWLYLPEFKRVRQITARARNESFAGTDLTYHDLDVLAQLTQWSEADARSSLRGQEPIEGVPCWAIELAPQHDEESYKKIVVWLGTEDLIPRQVWLQEDPSGEPTKQVVQGDVRPAGAIPVPRHVVVTTPARQSHTDIATREIAFDRQLPDDMFTQAQLERGEP